MKIWKLRETDANLDLMSKVLEIQMPTAAVLAHRGIRSKNTAIRYLRADLNQADILIMKDAQKAIERIDSAIKAGERIMIYGDYDADGVMSTTILYKALKACGTKVHFYIPNREEEGYGLNSKAIHSIKSSDYDLIIACDNGISALDEIAEANALGMDIIVIDHHEPGFVGEGAHRRDVLPDAFAIVDPKQANCPYPFKEMCAGGLAFSLMKVFYTYTGRDFSALHDELLALAAISTVCDIVDLSADNRAIVKNGLLALNHNKMLNKGLGQLITLKGYLEKPIDTFTLGFVIGPCINATGRLESAEMSVRLLISSDENEQVNLARNLSDLNEERKNLTRSCVDRVLEKCTLMSESDFSVLLAVDHETHESIAGIVAGRVKDRLNKPVIVLTKSSEEGVLKGSGRSIPAYNMFEALYENRDLFLRFGGHAMAAGLSIVEENAEQLLQRLNANCQLTEVDLQTVLEIDQALNINEITLKLAQELEMLSPFGKGNSEPLFVSYNMAPSTLRVIDDKNTLIFTFDRIKAIAFGLNDTFLERLQEAYGEQTYRRIVSGEVQNLTMDLAYVLETNTYNGRTSAQMRIRDFKIN